MPFVVVYDANALYGNAQRDLLIRIAQSGLVQAKWTDQILDEMLSNLGKKRPDIPAGRLGILRERMNGAVRDCLVTGYEPLIESLQLLDPRRPARAGRGYQEQCPGHCHDQPEALSEAELRPWNVEAKSPDDFVLDQINIDARIVYSCVREIANSRRNPPDTVDDVLAELERAGLVQSVAALRLG